MLHVYGSAVHWDIARSTGDRQRLQTKVTIPGLPQLVIAEEEDGLFWLIEERLQGSNAHAGQADAWFPQAIEWLCQLADLKGPPLRTTPFWDAHEPDAFEFCPPGFRPTLRAAWDCLGDVPAGPLHGDVQPQNLILGPHGVGLIDWEGMWLHGLPGLDILFLASMTARDVPAPIVPELLAGRSVDREDLLRSALGRCGYDDDTMRAALWVTLSLWCVGESRRLQREPSGRPTPFGDLLTRALRDST